MCRRRFITGESLLYGDTLKCHKKRPRQANLHLLREGGGGVSSRLVGGDWAEYSRLQNHWRLAAKFKKN